MKCDLLSTALLFLPAAWGAPGSPPQHNGGYPVNPSPSWPSAPSGTEGPSSPSTDSPQFDNITIFTPPPEWPNRKTSYARTVILNQNCETSNVILLTFTANDPSGHYYPVYSSADQGLTWTPISRIYFTEADTGLDYSQGFLAQPSLLELPIPLGPYPAGTVLFSGMGSPNDHSSTNIYIYASLDAGHTWTYASHVASGSAPNTTNGAHPIWEPFLLMHGSSLLDMYSDQRDPAHGQKLAHQTTTDLQTWGAVVDDAAEANYTLRPGMTTVAKMGDGRYIFTYEMGNAVQSLAAGYAVHYRIAEDPEMFQEAEEFLLQSSTPDQYIVNSGPYVVWTPVGPKGMGTVVVSDSYHEEVFMNFDYGDPAKWVTVAGGADGYVHGQGYTRCLEVLPDQSKILLVNGGMFDANDTMVSAGIVDVPGTLGEWDDTISSCGGKGFWNS